MPNFLIYGLIGALPGGAAVAVATMGRREQLAGNAEEIQQIGHELYERLCTMVGPGV